MSVTKLFAFCVLLHVQINTAHIILNNSPGLTLRNPSYASPQQTKSKPIIVTKNIRPSPSYGNFETKIAQNAPNAITTLPLTLKQTIPANDIPNALQNEKILASLAQFAPISKSAISSTLASLLANSQVSPLVLEQQHHAIPSQTVSFSPLSSLEQVSPSVYNQPIPFYPDISSVQSQPSMSAVTQSQIPVQSMPIHQPSTLPTYHAPASTFSPQSSYYPAPQQNFIPGNSKYYPKPSNLKMLLPILFNLLKEKNITCGPNCNCPCPCPCGAPSDNLNIANVVTDKNIYPNIKDHNNENNKTSTTDNKDDELEYDDSDYYSDDD